MRSILDKSFTYVPAKDHEGDPTYLLRKFRRMEKERLALSRRNSEERERVVVGQIKERRKA